MNGESIYGAGRSPFGPYSATQKDRAGKPVFKARRDWRGTTKPGKLYVHLFKGPDSAFELTGVQERVAKAYLLADSQRTPLRIAQSGTAVSVARPKTAPDRVDSACCIDLAGK